MQIRFILELSGSAKEDKLEMKTHSIITLRWVFTLKYAAGDEESSGDFCFMHYIYFFTCVEVDQYDHHMRLFLVLQTGIAELLTGKATNPFYVIISRLVAS